MRTNNHLNTKQLFDFQENIVPGLGKQEEAELRSISARIPVEAYQTIEHFAKRWGFSNSSLIAQIIETSCNELDLLERINGTEDDTDTDADADTSARSAAL